MPNVLSKSATPTASKEVVLVETQNFVDFVDQAATPGPRRRRSSDAGKLAREQSAKANKQTAKDLGAFLEAEALQTKAAAATGLAQRQGLVTMTRAAEMATAEKLAGMQARLAADASAARQESARVTSFTPNDRLRSPPKGESSARKRERKRDAAAAADDPQATGTTTAATTAGPSKRARR